MKRKPTIMLLLLSILFGSIIFFLLGIVLSLIINFIYLNNFSVDEQDIFKTSVLSLIAGTAGGTGSWIFAKIDERNISKSPPSDRE
ncbi:hypothetical protein [Rosenbergiella collisarenosi]|uniref:hypothetical protein n=1 Tax=Rosenbergiella collisarenosi TaxID=1544695 RepID=UPI001BD9E93E|nr:hypothetical protein [Rosenbergiella collisarenosi]MBT0722693.1 hypothetical protein [Rosenbergiella collisarenosi]